MNENERETEFEATERSNGSESALYERERTVSSRFRENARANAIDERLRLQQRERK
jgi:hypothetical protein